MKGWQKMSRILVFALLGTITLAMGSLDPAIAHDWFTALNDPETKGRCCGGTDCATVPQEMLDSGAVTPVKDGFYVNLTLAQAQHFNKSATKPLSEHIAWSRVLPDQSKDPNGTGYSLCIVGDAIQCFIAPQGY